MKADVAIVGAGTAGAAAAYLCARRGLSVALLDRRPLDEAGARWVNGVPEWMFDEAGIERPSGEELVGRGHDFHLVAGYGPRRLVLRDHGVVEVDMRLLVARLQRLARDAGVTLVGEAKVERFDGTRLETSTSTVEARFVVDASGLAGARLLDQPEVERSDLCAAAQEVRRVVELDEARAWFLEQRTPPGHTLCFTSIAGGYSIINVRLEQDRLGILTGSIPADGHPSGKALLDRFAAEHAWIGETLYGGARAIPLRRPYDRIAAGNVAALGDAACQVFSAHGSGIGIGLVAARMLADALADGRGPEGYGVAFHRRWGGLLATYDLFRRFSQSLSTADVEAMLEAGLLDETAALAGLAERMPSASPSFVAAKLASALRAPRLSAKLGATLARAAAMTALYARYPADARDLPRWSRTVARVA